VNALVTWTVMLIADVSSAVACMGMGGAGLRQKRTLPRPVVGDPGALTGADQLPTLPRSLPEALGNPG
jgi:hypothetical protein